MHASLICHLRGTGQAGRYVGQISFAPPMCDIRQGPPSVDTLWSSVERDGSSGFRAGPGLGLLAPASPGSFRRGHQQGVALDAASAVAPPPAQTDQVVLRLASGRRSSAQCGWEGEAQGHSSPPQ